MDGKALVYTGVPSDDVEYNGVTYQIGQGNNALMYPGLGLGIIVAEAKVVTFRDFYGENCLSVGGNDAPALAASTVGVAMGDAGTDTRLETADIALMSDNLDKLPYTIKLSRKALAIIKQNITFS